MPLFLFEFMDHPKIPRAIRETLLDTLDFCNRDFRPYYRQVADEVVSIAKEHGIKNVVELGAGHGPLSKQLLDHPGYAGVVIPCDLYPEHSLWTALENEYGDRIQPVAEPVDFMVRREWPENTMLVLVAALHHIPFERRQETLEALHDSADVVSVFEPVRKTPFSILLTLGAVVPALLMPLFRLHKPGRIRRFLWSWLIPVVPLMFVWDAVVSCLRQWSPREWDRFAEKQPATARKLHVASSTHAQVVVW